MNILHRWRIRRQVPHFLKKCPDPFRGEVLEVGAGKGWTTRLILETFPQVELTALDNDPPVITKLTAIEKDYGQRLHVVQADALALPFDRGSFDSVVALNFFRHFDDVTPLCEQLLRVLRPGGLLGISDHDRGARKTLEDVLQKEECTILSATGTRFYDVWVRKPYQNEV